MTSQPTPPLALEAAAAMMLRLPPPVSPPVQVHLEAALGGVLAQDVRAAWPLPRFHNAAVDGWAVRLADCAPEGPTTLGQAGRIPAGAAPGQDLPPGQAARIFTGAPVPLGCDAVVMQENARTANGSVLLRDRPRPGQNIRRQGEQAGPGDILLRAGQRMGAAALALAAAGGAVTLPVQPPLRVGLLSTGDEVWPIGTPPPPGGIPDANGAMLAALLSGAGAAVVERGLLRDDAASLASRLRAMASRCDLIVTTGGVSVGEEDHMRAALAAVGSVLFWRLAVKPGRPTALATVDRTPVLALPGNPAAAFSIFHVLGMLLVRHLQGEAGVFLETRPTHRIAFTPSPPAGVHEILPVVIGSDGLATLASAGGSAKGGLAQLVAADGLALIGGTCPALTPGSDVPVINLPRI